MDTGQWVVIGLSALMGVWFALGTLYNRRRGVATYRWLVSGVIYMGEISEKAWIGSSGTGARLVVGKAKAPFQRVEVILLLESREILPIWLFNRVRKKQDEIILRADLHNAPSQEVEVAHPRDRQFRALLKEKDQWVFEQLPHQERLLLAYRGPESGGGLTRLTAFLDQYRTTVHRISLRRKKPHLVIRAYLPPLQEHSVKEFFISVEQLVSSRAVSR